MGFFPLGKLFGVPVRVHFSALLGALIFSGFRFAPGAWVGFFLVILLHELGHALVVRRTGQQVIGVNVHALGGECAWRGNPTDLQRAAIAWGGVWAQFALLAIALPVSLLFGNAIAQVPALGPHLWDLLRAFTYSNALIIAINLIPFPPLDGAEAWKLPKLWWARRQARKLRAKGPLPRVQFKAAQARSRVEDPRLPPQVAAILEDIARQAADARKPKRN